MTHRIWQAACVLLLVFFGAADLSAQSADLTVTVSDSPDPVSVGTNLTYTITVSNAGPNDATGVSLTVEIPVNTTFVSLAAPAGSATVTPPVGGTGAVTAIRTKFAAGTTAVFSMVVNVNSTAFFGTTLSNTATVTSTTPDPNAANNSDTETTATSGGLLSPDLTVTQTDTPDPVLAGTNLTYTVTVTNAGPTNASTVSLTDTIPANTTFVSITGPAGWTITSPAVGGTGTVTATRSTLAIVAPQVFTLVVRVNAATAAGTTISNIATAKRDGRSCPWQQHRHRNDDGSASQRSHRDHERLARSGDCREQPHLHHHGLERWPERRRQRQPDGRDSG